MRTPTTRKKIVDTPPRGKKLKNKNIFFIFSRTRTMRDSCGQIFSTSYGLSRRFLLRREPSHWWGFYGKIFYEIVTILWIVFADQIFYYFDAIFAVARCGVSWLPTTRFRMGDLISAAPDLNLARCPRHVASPKALVLSKNSTLARKCLSETFCCCILSKTNQSSLAYSMPPYVRRERLVSAFLVSLRTYVVSVFWVWCRTESVLWVCVSCACGVCQCVRELCMCVGVVSEV